ncbi:MAG: hypothetical protein Q8M11_22055 [Sulfuritalea sp.]|nr:hypothetical protein [Sulfuritalea sp.]MDP1981619.1 hypothetical protein [Sulfuritalea sp.]
MNTSSCMRRVLLLLFAPILLFQSFVALAQSVYSGSTIFIVPQTTDNTPQNGVIKTPTNNTINNSPNSQPVTQPTSEPIVIVNQGPDPDLYLHEGHGWDRDTSHTECGGLRRDGKPQPRCKLKPANYQGPARGTCPAGTVFDIGLWGCWSCDRSKGFERTLAAVDSDRACAKTATWNETQNKARFKPATFLGNLCPGPDANYEKAFFDTIRGGECWACPKGYNTNVLPHVAAGNKCTRPGRRDVAYAELSFRTKNAANCVNRADGADLGQRVFYDGLDFNYQGPGCWKCPVGFERSASSVISENACFREIPADDLPAVARSVGKCEAGTITDPRNNGECWKCPETYDRVLLNPINSPQACETTPGTVFSRGKLEAALTCPAGQDFDFIKVDQTSLSALQKAGRASTRTQAAPNGGTCWACPPEHKRTWNSVTDSEACQGETTEWYAAPLDEPGLFRFDGAHEVVLEILQHDRQTIDDVIREMVRLCAESKDDPEAANACRANPNKEITEAWAEIRDTPGMSSLLMSLVLGRISIAATEGRDALPTGVRKATAADKRLMASFAGYVQMRNTYVAAEALKAFDAWENSNRYWKAWEQSQNTRDMFGNTKNPNQGGNVTEAVPQARDVPPPPDWHEVVQNAMIASVSGMTVLAGGTVAVISASPKLKKLVRPYSGIRKGIKKGVDKLGKEAGEEVLEEVGKKITEKLAKPVVNKTAGKVAQKALAKALTKGASGVLKFMKAAGPAFVVTAVIEAFVEVAVKMDEYSRTDRPHLLTMVAQAQQPVDLGREFLTEERSTLIEGYWMLAMSGLADPSSAQAIQIQNYVDGKTPAPVALQQGVLSAKTWSLLPGSAVDVAASANALWVIGTNPVPGGYGLHRWDGKSFVAASGGAVRIDLDPQGNPWVVNNAGKAFRWTGTAWVGLPGDNAQDIGVGANGTAWMVGGAKVPGGFSIWRWNTGGNRWDAMSGGGVRIDVDPEGNAWLVNDAGAIFRWTGSNWVGIPGKARDIGVGPEGSVFIVGAGNNGTIHKWNGSTWIQRDGGLNEISVGPGGVPVGVNAGKQIWMGYP